MNEIIPINLGFVYAYLVKGKNKSILVDCGFPGQEAKIMRFLDRKGIKPGDISLIVITHGDIDHYGSSYRLRELLSAPVLVHQSDSNIIRTGINRKIHANGPIGYIMKYMALLLTALTKHRYNPFEPDVIMQTEQYALETYGVNGYLLHTPGETAGSISVIVSDEKVIVGDLIAGIVPHSDIPVFSPFSENRSDVKKSLKKILDLKPQMIFTGHSQPISVKKHLNRLTRLIN